MTDERTRLLRMLAQQSFRIAETRLSAGGVSDYYIDCRTTTLCAEGGRLAGLLLLDLLQQTKLELRAVGGMTLGADPVVSNITAASAWRAAMDGHVTTMDGFLVRKEAKAYGAGRRIEGFCEPGTPVAIVDDACTTGASIVKAIRAAQEAEMRVVAVACLVERQEVDGRQVVEAAAPGAPFLSVFSGEEVRAQYLELAARA